MDAESEERREEGGGLEKVKKSEERRNACKKKRATERDRGNVTVKRKLKTNDTLLYC